MSAQEKYLAVQTLAAKLKADHIIASPPQVWKRGEYINKDPEKIPTNAENLVNRMGFVFMAYRIDMWWWEVLERIYMFCMTTLVVFVYPGSPAQMAAAAMVAFVFLMANTILQPYCTDDLNMLKVFSLFTQFVTAFSGIMISYIESVDTVGDADQEIDHGIVTVILIMSNVSVVMLPFLKPILGRDTEEYKERALALFTRTCGRKTNHETSARKAVKVFAAQTSLVCS